MINNTSMKKLITRIIQVSTLIASFLISSLRCPTSLINWPRVVIVAVYVIALLVVHPTKCVKYLITLSLILGIVTGIYYLGILDSKAVTIDGQIYVKGQLTERTKDYLEKYPSVTEEEYFIWAGKKQSEIWTSESLGKNKLILGGLYSFFTGLIAFGILGGLEIILKSNSSQLQSVSGKMAKNQKTNGKQDNL